MADGKVKIDVELAKEQFEKDVNGLTKSTEKSFSGMVESIKKLLGGLAIGTALKKLGSIGMQFNADMEMYTTNFKVMLGEQEAAVKKVDDLKKMAAKTPFELGDLAQATQTLLAFNVATEDTQDVLSMLGDISLGNADKLQSLTRAYGKMNAAQKVTLEDINIMIDAGFNPLLLVAEQTGETMTEVYDRVSAGKVSVEEVTAAMKTATSEGGQFFNGMEEASKTFIGQISTLKDNFNELLGNATKPLFDYLTNTALPKAIDLVGYLNENLDIMMVILGEVTGFVSIVALIKKIGKQWGIASTALAAYLNGTKALSIQSAIVGVLTGKIKLATAATTLWSKAMAFLAANKFFIIAGAIVGVATAIGIASKKAGGFDKLLKKIQEKFPEIIETISEKIPEYVNIGLQILQNIIKGITDNLPNLIDSAISILTNLANFLIQNIPIIINAGLNLLLGLIKGLIDNLPQLIKAGLELVVALVTGILQNLPELLETALTLVVEIGKTIISSLPQIISAGGKIIEALWDGIWQLVSWFLGKIVDFAKKIPEKIVEGIGNIAEIGKDIVKGLWEGIKGAAGWFGDKLGGFASGVKDKFKDMFGIASPSKWMRDMIGKNLVLGMAVGIDKSSKKAIKSIEGISAKIKDASQVSLVGHAGVGRSTTETITNNNQVVQNFYNKQTTPYEAYRKAGAAFAY